MNDIDENYIVHTKCQQCYRGGNTKQLDKLVLQLKCSDNDECFRLMLIKGVYPYEHSLVITMWGNHTSFVILITYTWKVLQITIINMLKMYCKTFNIEDTSMYHDLYMNSDVLVVVVLFIGSSCTNATNVSRVSSIKYFRIHYILSEYRK